MTGTQRLAVFAGIAGVVVALALALAPVSARPGPSSPPTIPCGSALVAATRPLGSGGGPVDLLDPERSEESATLSERMDASLERYDRLVCREAARGRVLTAAIVAGASVVIAAAGYVLGRSPEPMT